MGRKWDYDVPSKEIWEQCLRVLKPGGHLLAFAGTRTQHRMCVNIEDAGFEIRDMIAWVYGSGFPKGKSCLKPALEPITMARKRAKKVQPLNIDGCRVATDDNLNGGAYAINGLERTDDWSFRRDQGLKYVQPSGRWPANLIHDGSDEVTELFGDAQRFFYVPKCNKKDRDDGNTHPTVKPTDLMAYLCRLVTPPGGIVLDPFMGSGSTGKAAIREGFQFIGIEREEEYIAIARERVVEPERQQLSLIA
jgi:site-specific DNA-methyltransferase (adenine-specific)